MPVPHYVIGNEDLDRESKIELDGNKFKNATKMMKSQKEPGAASSDHDLINSGSPNCGKCLKNYVIDV